MNYTNLSTVNNNCASAHILLAEELASTVSEADKYFRQALKIAANNVSKCSYLFCFEVIIFGQTSEFSDVQNNNFLLQLFENF